MLLFTYLFICLFLDFFLPLFIYCGGSGGSTGQTRAHVHHGMHMEVRKQHTGAASLLAVDYGDQIQLTKLGGKCPSLLF